MNTLANVANPFGRPVVADAWGTRGIDVPEINARAFETCMSAFNRAASGEGSESVLLHGAAGSGKTHLLGRLQHHLVTDGAKTAADGALRCIFVAVKLQTSPHMLWQHLRRRFADDILRETEGASQLQRLVAHYLAASAGENARAWVRKIRVLTQIEDEHVESLLEEVSSRAGLSHDVKKVLSHLLYRRNVSEARGWLRGDPLPEETLVRLGLSSADTDAEEQARDCVVSLCRLAEKSLPIVFCFDQIEALQSRNDDTAGFLRLGHLLAELFEADNNILLITCIQSSVVTLFKDAVREANWQRIARRETTLDPLDRKLATLLLQRRLDADPALATLRKAHPDQGLWPLSSSDVEGFFADEARATARRVLLRAEQIFFERAKGAPPPPPIPTEIFLEQELERRLDGVLRKQRPADTEENLRHGLPLVVNALDLPWRSSETDDRDVHLKFDGKQDRRVELSVCNAQNMTSLASTLKRLVKREVSGEHIIVRDPRIPISKGAKKCREYLSTLTKRGVRLFEPDVALLGLLEAVRTMLSDARAGDLMYNGLPLPVQTVEKWLRDALDEHLLTLVQGVLPNEAQPIDEAAHTDRVQDLAALLAEHLIIPADEVTRSIGYSTKELEELVHQHPTRFGLLSGPPAVLFACVPPIKSPRAEEERS